jgi:aspartate aminotransferase
MVKLGGGTPVFVKGHIENDYKPTADQIKSAITSNTKLLIYSSPGNPTGSVFSQQELEQIADILKPREKIYVIADEIYEYINFSGEHASMAAIPGMLDNTITVNGFSKGFAMTGWRVGYISAPLWIAKACEKMQGQVTSGTNSIAQRAALAAYTSDMSATQDMAKAYLERRGMVYELLNAIPGLKNYLPGGAFYFFPDISYYLGKSNKNKVINNAGDLSIYMLEEYHVSVVSGEAFGEPNNIRISYAASESDLREGISRIKEALSNME